MRLGSTVGWTVGTYGPTARKRSSTASHCSAVNAASSQKRAVAAA